MTQPKTSFVINPDVSVLSLMVILKGIGLLKISWFNTILVGIAVPLLIKLVFALIMVFIFGLFIKKP